MSVYSDKEILEMLKNETINAFQNATLIAKENNFNDLWRLSSKSSARLFLDGSIPDNFEEKTYDVLNSIKSKLNDFLELIQADPNNVEAFDKIIWCYIIINDFDTAFNIMERVISRNTEIDGPKGYKFGFLYHYFGQYDKALNLYNITKGTTYYKVDLDIRNSIIQRRLKNFPKSLELLKSVKGKAPHYLKEDDIDLMIAYTYQCQCDYQNAYLIFNELFKKHPSNENAFLCLLFVIYVDSKSNNNLKHVKQFIETTKTLFPNSANINLIRGKVFIYDGNLSEAYKYFSMCVDDLALSPQFWCLFGKICFLNEQYKDSIKAFERGLQLSSVMPELWLNLIKVYEKIENRGSAYNLVQQANHICPGFKEFRLSVINDKKIEMVEPRDETLFPHPAELVSESISQIEPIFLPEDLDLPPGTEVNLTDNLNVSLF